MRKYGAFALALCVAALAACDKNGVQDISAPASGAAVKFYNFGVNAPAVNFYANTQKITAISSANCQPPNDTTTVCRTTGNETTTGTGFGAGGNGGLYTQLAPGSYTLSGKISAATDKDLAVSNVTQQVDNGKFYTYFISGVYDATGKKVDAFVVEDPIPTISDYSQAYVRFVNAVSTSSPTTLSVKSQTSGTSTNIGSATAYKNATAFVAVPAGVYDLTGSGSGATLAGTSFSFVGGHAYTVIARGDNTSSVTANKPAFSSIANR